MQRTWFHSGLMAAGLVALLSTSAWASGPSDKCKDGATQCREAFEKLETCQRAPAKKAEKPAEKEGEKPAAEPTEKDAKEAKEADNACAAERTATDAACKTTNTACTKDGSRHAPHARKD